MEEAKPWDLAIRDGLAEKGPYFLLVALGCAIGYLSFIYCLNRSSFRLREEGLNSIVIGAALAALIAYFIAIVGPLINGRPAIYLPAIIPIALIYPHLGLALFLWIFTPWKLQKCRIQTRAFAIAVTTASIFLSLTLGTWAPS